MKRDLDLVREILRRVSDADTTLTLDGLTFEGKTINDVAYHVEMLAHKGYLDATVERSWGGDCVSIMAHAVTWDGADFLEATGNNEVWTRAKKAVRESVGTTTLSVLKQVCEEVAKGLIKAQLDL